MNTPINRAQEAFENLKQDHTFVVFEKHGGALRNTYGTAIPQAMPDIVMGDTLPWSQDQPEGVYVTEQYNPHRGEAGPKDADSMILNAANHINRIGKNAVIYSWFNTPHVQKLTKNLESPATIIARDEEVCGYIEDKSLLQTHLWSAGCLEAMTPRHVVANMADDLPDFGDTAAIFGEKFVIQGKSMGGDGTVIVSGRDAYESARKGLKGRIRVSEFIDAQYSSVYCLSLPHANSTDVAVFVDGSSHKPVNIPDLGIGDTAGAGGEWLSPHEQFDSEQLTSDISKLAKYFYQTNGYHGHFVVEGFVREGKFVFNEINARPGGGSEVNSLYQIEQGLPSFTTAHILGRLGLLCAEDMPSPDIYNHYAQKRSLAGQSEGAFYLKYKNTTGSRIVTSDRYKGSGVYALGSNGFSKIGEPIVSTAAQVASAEVLISNGPAPAVGSVADGKQICTIEGRLEGHASMVNQDNRLRPDLKRIIDNLSGLFVVE